MGCSEGTAGFDGISRTPRTQPISTNTAEASTGQSRLAHRPRHRRSAQPRRPAPERHTSTLTAPASRVATTCARQLYGRPLGRRTITQNGHHDSNCRLSKVGRLGGERDQHRESKNRVLLPADIAAFPLERNTRLMARTVCLGFSVASLASPHPPQTLPW